MVVEEKLDADEDESASRRNASDTDLGEHIIRMSRMTGLINHWGP